MLKMTHLFVFSLSVKHLKIILVMLNIESRVLN